MSPRVEICWESFEVRAKASLLVGSSSHGSPGRTRTGTPYWETDFKSAASTNSATGPKQEALASLSLARDQEKQPHAHKLEPCL